MGENRTEVPAMPFTHGAGCTWFQANDAVYAVDASGTEVFRAPLRDPQRLSFAWAHDALWIADQNHNGAAIYRIGE